MSGEILMHLSRRPTLCRKSEAAGPRMQSTPVSGSMSRMDTPTPAAGLQRLDALITPDLSQYVDPVRRASRVAWGTMFSALYTVRAIRTLHSGGQCHAALPLLRTAIEYTLGTIWLADAGDDAVDVLNRRLQASHKKLDGHLSSSGLDGRFPPGALQVMRKVVATDLPPHPDETLIGFAHLLSRYGFDEMLPVYDTLSGLSHLSLEGAQEFFRETTTTVALSQNPLETPLATHCETLSLGLQFDSMFACNELFPARPWSAALAEIARDHDLTPPLPANRKNPRDQTIKRG